MTADTGRFYPCIVVSTTGRVSHLRALLESLSQQSDQQFVVGVCDQSADEEVRLLVAAFARRLNIFTTSSKRGLSAGRNSVIRNSPPNVTHFLFPNDTTYYSSGFLEHLKAQHSTCDIAAFSYVDQSGVRYEFDSGRSGLSRRNVWKIIEAGMLVSKKVLPDGYFDETLGTGSPSPWQSGEGTDLLLRTLHHAPVVHWDPESVVYGVTQDDGLIDMDRRRKLRAYGRGYGYLHRKWRYPIHRVVIICIAPLVKSLLSRELSFFDATNSALGRIEGVSRCLLAKR